jgi:hypothetical protein
LGAGEREAARRGLRDLTGERLRWQQHSQLANLLACAQVASGMLQSTRQRHFWSL